MAGIEARTKVSDNVTAGKAPVMFALHASHDKAPVMMTAHSHSGGLVRLLSFILLKYGFFPRIMIQASIESTKSAYPEYTTGRPTN